MKKSLGRRKIEIKKLEKKSTQQVTFSKRRAGLFNKAAELSVLCGAEIAILVASSRNKLYTFGHPNVESLLDRFLTGNSAPPKPAEAYLPLDELNRDFDDVAAEYDIEKRRTAERLSNDRFWWDEPLESMKIDELKRFRSSLVDLRGKVAERVEKFTAMRKEGSLLPALQPSTPPSIDLVENLERPPTPPPSIGRFGNLQWPSTPPSIDLVENLQRPPTSPSIGLFENLQWPSTPPSIDLVENLQQPQTPPSIGLFEKIQWPSTPPSIDFVESLQWSPMPSIHLVENDQCLLSSFQISGNHSVARGLNMLD
ncbi:agamous-like MADS-box protein AGL61 [Cucurbita pepo subsp. pepo]|uniref:agamous-like MADS-box protein AGL61 n=1 Tax=Cucurbita pepo subsp. pepo TaxID=3664 RepID=UPI000C9D6687|nr:agamous-like MADS-box protein AGL61 [Cucurbita pepo subsp. pepo]